VSKRRHNLAEEKNERATFSIPEACQYLGISRPSFYRLLDDKAIGSINVGRRRLVPRREIDKYIDEKLAEGGHDVEGD
jgi:excisionase family DNA binding protein